MNKSHKIIVLLLVLAIMFSVISIVVNISVIKLDIFNKSPFNSRDLNNDRGNVILYVEEDNEK